MLAAVFGLLFVHFARSGLPLGLSTVAQWSTAAQILFFASWSTSALCAFNLVPVPPLDGSAVVERFIPARWWPTYLRYRQYTMPALLILVLLNFFFTGNGHVGPLTWLFDRLYNWWGSVLGI